MGPQPATKEEGHLALTATTWPLLSSETVLSHATAGVLWGLPVPDHLLERVHATRSRDAGGKVGRHLHLHVRELLDTDVVQKGDYRVTNLSRTAVDLARLCPPAYALSVFDAAWRLEGSGDGLVDQVLGDSGRTGVGKARWALGHADPRAESPAESVSRYWMLVGGVPTPELQYEVRDEAGVLLGRSDFAWPELGVIGEFDGRIKYDGLVAPGESAADVVMREKRRENRLRAHGWWVLRWTWAELRDGPRFARWLNESLRRGPGRH